MGRKGFIRIWRAILGMACLLLAFAGPAGAASAGAASAPPASASPASASAAAATVALSTQDLKNLIATLQSEPARQKLIGELQALIAAREKSGAPSAPQAAAPPAAPNAELQTFGTRLITAISARVAAASDALTDAATALVELPAKIDALRQAASQGETRRNWLRLLGKLAVVLVLALAADWLAGRALRPLSAALDPRPGEAGWLRPVRLVARFLLELVPIFVFGAAVYLALPFVDAHRHVRLTAIAIVNAVVLVRALLALGRLVLAPQRKAQRLIPMEDETAGYWYVWLRRLASLVVYGYFAIEIARILGLPRTGGDALARLIGLVVTGLLLMLIMQNRRAVRHWIHGREETASTGAIGVLRARLAETWHALAFVYVVVIYAVWAFRVPNGFDYLLRATLLTIAIAVVARLLATGAESLLRRFFSIGGDLKKRFPALEARADRYLPALAAAFRALIYLVALVSLLQAWGLDSFGWLASGSGRRIVAGAASIAVTVIVSVIVWEILTFSSDVYLARKIERDRSAHRRARAHTLLPLLRKAMSLVLIAIAALIILSALGVNIGPMLAGLGVAGIAVGLGAQSLVKDLITGLFIVLEDTIAVGDVVELAGNSGQVEAISIRAIRLRDQSGTVYTIPFSAVTQIKNLTKDFSYALFDIGIAYRENVDRVIEEIVALGAEMRRDPAWERVMLEPLEMIGLDRFADSAVIVRARIKTVPLEQWNVMREFNRRLKRRFDELGIEMPFPQRTVWFGVDKDGNAPPLRVAREDEMAPAPKPAPGPA
ncbi:MAG TPA: mechanosensitive ion channel domain-containing protein [Alphaproteobacteria bacterium]|nr:mechanosensitive ion channel domain-containing protein [Alphaproteobacteria bacterium]